MTRVSLLISIIALLAVPAAAQSGSNYTVDNFDFANAVRIQTPAPSTRTQGKRKTRLSNSTSFTPSGTSLVHPTSMTFSSSLGGFTTGNSMIDEFIVSSGRRNSVDPLLLYAIMHQESTFKPRAMSYKGARGLMQLMPGTASRFGVSNIWDPQQNIEGGSRYMRFLLDKFNGDVPLALAGYNAGEGAVMKYGYNVPPYAETREYVRRITKRYALIRNPEAARYASNFSREQVAVVQQKESAPLSMYERSVFAVQLPDGRLQLISQ